MMNNPRWHDAAAYHSWLDAQLVRLGWASARITRLHQRPWSIVFVIERGDGARFYAKASAPPLAYEANLTAAMDCWAPGLGPRVLAVERERGWFLLADAGTPLRAQLGSSAYLPQWRQLLPHFAEAQRALQERAASLLALGLPDRRLERLPALFCALLEDRPALCLGKEEGLSEGEWLGLRAQLPAFAEDCARLAEFGIAPSLHHDDFHDGNIFASDDGALTLADWGESALAHPFFSLRVALRYLAYRLKLAADAPELSALADAYLALWGDPERLRPALALALRLASVNRALTWAGLAPLSADREDRTAAAAWLRVYLQGEG